MNSTVAMPITSSSLHASLQDFFGFDTFKGTQEAVITDVLNGKDTFVIMPTGGGKSLCYQLPALMMEGTALVISPLIALMKNQVDSIRSHSKTDDVAHFLNSSLTKAQMKKVKEDIVDGKTKLLFIAPETLTKEENLEFFHSVNISFVAVDEAHCISEWGHDFRPEYRRIRIMIDAINPEIPIVALTATATPKVQSDILKNLNMRETQQHVSSFNRNNLYYEIRPKLDKEQTFKSILGVVKSLANKSGIIYVQARKSTEEIAKFLCVNGVKAAPYHAGLDPKTRSRTQDDFLMENVDVIVATIAFGMGIDKPDVRFVIHFNIPKSIENYYQETGRAGRDGLEGRCVSYYSYKDIHKLEKFLRDKPVAERDMGNQLLQEVIGYAETAACRRQYLLHYFGERYDIEECNKMCDNCRHPKERVEAKDDLKLALQSILELEENYKVDTLVDFISGNETKEMKDYKFDQRALYGTGSDKDVIYWNTIFRQGIIHDYIHKDIETYGLLMVRPEGHAFLKKPTSFEVPINHNYADDSLSYDENAGKTAVLDQTLLKMLQDMRKQVSKKHNLPPFIIFQDPSLEDMATQYPISMDDMVSISGVNRGKAIKYGKPFMELIKNYVEENEIDRPTEIVVKQVANKSKTKVEIIKGLDRKVPIEEIAEASKMTMEELLEEMYAIVNSGTKLSLDYFIEDYVDEDVYDDIEDYFSEAETDSVEVAFNELKEDDVTMEEIMLVRIKYMSDKGN